MSASTDILYGPHPNYGPEKNTRQPCTTNCLLAPLKEKKKLSPSRARPRMMPKLWELFSFSFVFLRAIWVSFSDETAWTVSEMLHRSSVENASQEMEEKFR